MQMIERKHRYLPLDALRCVAILLVFLQHAVPGGIPFGRTGVDLFFVLSGYLITGGLLRSRQTKGYFSKFYIRRALRIFPAYYLLIVATILIMPSRLDGLLPWALVYLANVGQSISGDQSSALTHLWSLGVEEQFYLLWPAALWLVRSRVGRLRLIIALVVLAPVFRFFLAEAWNWESAYTLLPARMDGLVIGAGIALAQNVYGIESFVRRRRQLLVASGIGALVMVAGTKLTTWTQTDHMVVALWVSVLFYGLAVATALAWRDTKLADLASWAPIVYIGQISYGIYLYHILVLHLLDDRIDQPVVVLVGGAVATVAVAMVSYHLFEKPVNDQRHRFESPSSRPAEDAVA